VGTKDNPGKYDCYAKLEDDEPFFVLRAKDPAAPALILRWADERQAVFGPNEKIDEARRCARQMQVWLKSHPEHDQSLEERKGRLKAEMKARAK